MDLGSPISLRKHKSSRQIKSYRFKPDNYVDSTKKPPKFEKNADSSQVTKIEANFMMIEDGLSRNSEYIQQNFTRIPFFPSAAKAEEELRNLWGQLNRLNRNEPVSEPPNISNRLTQIKRQHQTLSDEDQKISKLKSMSDDTKAQEDAEYQAILNQISEAEDELSSIKSQVAQYTEESNYAKSKLQDAKDNLQSRQNRMNQLKAEEKRLLKLQKQSRQELKSLQSELDEFTRQDAQISEIEAQIETNSKEYKRLTKILEDKQQLIQEKTAKVQKILQDTLAVENKLDEAVGYAGSIAQQSQEPTYHSDSFDPHYEQSKLKNPQVKVKKRSQTLSSQSHKNSTFSYDDNSDLNSNLSASNDQEVNLGNNIESDSDFNPTQERDIKINLTESDKLTNQANLDDDLASLDSDSLQKIEEEEEDNDFPSSRHNSFSYNQHEKAINSSNNSLEDDSDDLKIDANKPLQISSESSDDYNQQVGKTNLGNYNLHDIDDDDDEDIELQELLEKNRQRHLNQYNSTANATKPTYSSLNGEDSDNSDII